MNPNNPFHRTDEYREADRETKYRYDERMAILLEDRRHSQSAHEIAYREAFQPVQQMELLNNPDQRPAI